MQKIIFAIGATVLLDNIYNGAIAADIRWRAQTT